ncbi:hypothetical protein [Bacillus thuringiensis]|uniref:hypothetical protein n=1 Tax=Bacillus thuringiensis TaxID=1428 RepID=UPI0011A9913B|nr:hypothetical protein [Bacillus thuringiensis]
MQIKAGQIVDVEVSTDDKKKGFVIGRDAEYIYVEFFEEGDIKTTLDKIIPTNYILQSCHWCSGTGTYREDVSDSGLPCPDCSGKGRVVVDMKTEGDVGEK